jgi:hypothetical protein
MGTKYEPYPRYDKMDILTTTESVCIVHADLLVISRGTYYVTTLLRYYVTTLLVPTDSEHALQKHVPHSALQRVRSIF